MSKYLLDLSEWSKKEPARPKAPSRRVQKSPEPTPQAAQRREGKLPSGRFSLKDQVYLAKRLAYLITAGVSVVESLHILRDQASNKGQRAVLDKIAKDVASGQSLSRSFAKFPQLFG